MHPINQLLIAQYEAAFLTLKNCLDACPIEIWNGPVVNHSFNQSLFHALFFADVYLGEHVDELEQQDFHRENVDTFAGYEEWEDRKPENSYSKSFLNAYLEHDLEKMRRTVGSQGETELQSKVSFHWLDLTRAELHVYNIRHLQHHAAQLIMRLRLHTDVNIGWQKSGWN